MSRLIYVHSRSRKFDKTTEQTLLRICSKLTPDNITTPPPHTVRVEEHTAYALANSGTTATVSRLSVMLGLLFDDACADWQVPNAPFPDGSYLIVRKDDRFVEVVSDAAGSRTIWFYFDEELFVASSSQRAIIAFIGSFAFDHDVIPWMLSTGSLGPERSWDTRIRRVQADSSVLLDGHQWTITTKVNPIVFAPVDRPRAGHRKDLEDAIAGSIAALRALDFGQWALPLSGGYDSRGILCFIRDTIGVPADLTAITWGLEESLVREGSDAKIAADLARAVGVRHRYVHTDMSIEPIERIVDRFIRCAEGRIDHIGGYMDGLEIWKNLYETGVCGIIRGDEGFGWVPVSSEQSVRLEVGCALCSDFQNLRDSAERLGLRPQTLPAPLARKAGESLNQWRDRLYHAFRLPTILAALSDIKFAYVEQINPLLSRRILSVVRGLPDRLRTNKALFREIVDSVSPGIPYATEGSNRSILDILRDERLAGMLRQALSDPDARRHLAGGFLASIVAGIRTAAVDAPSMPRGHRLISIARLLVPRFVKNLLRKSAVLPRVDGNVVAFRVFTVLRMLQILEEDARGR